MNEYCDSGQCPAQARVTVFTRHGPLFMCGHHFRRHWPRSSRSCSARTTC